ncbi:hypothetical protein B0H63DRAFT_510640 [Podospora didyma]|uniref:Uncharacterized protein n=1 Tax=Podospora didyma TaxID=330526 RepID=A0AAE0NR67_9PEZI|nr:hypothetical protein B0H63DRAFT_510640 [Podospora didyma]
MVGREQVERFCSLTERAGLESVRIGDEVWVLASASVPCVLRPSGEKQYRLWALERQARGEEIDEYMEPAIDLSIPERARLAEILCHQPKDLSDEQMFQRRIEAIDLYMALRGFIKPEVEFELASDPLSDPFPLLMNENQCPECFGDELLTLGERAFRYSLPTKRNDHFDDHHLEAKERAEQLGQLIICKHEKCKDVKLYTVDHFRNHVESVHTIALRTSDQVQQRRARKLKLRRSRNSG